MCSRVTLDGHVIEQCVKAGDGKFKEGAWVQIAEEYEDHPEKVQLANFKGRFGQLTRRYHGCWCVKWLSEEEAIMKANGLPTQGFGPWEMCKLGSEFNEAWLRYASQDDLNDLRRREPA
mmetsp:Transcript_48934/g.116508  ORF Transcript_48934/g.116508 Transcript_48934/m.116508 type:complete len:119 (-) Transcript_48934:123-479(-)